MYFKTIPVSPHLSHIVKEYLFLHFEFDANLFVPIKPFPVRPQHSLIFYLRGGVNSFDPETGKYKTFPKISINGSQTKRFDFHLNHSQIMFSIDFQPNGLSKFLKMPLNHEFLDERIDAEALLNPQIGQIFEQLQNTKNLESMIEIIETYLWQKIYNQSFDYQPIDDIGLLISQNPSAFSMEYLANRACLSFSQFERRFKNEIGVSPKFFARINRFHQANLIKEQNLQIDWLSIALKTGYNDYQHMVKDFKQFAGTTPNSLLQAQANAPEKILGLA